MSISEICTDYGGLRVPHKLIINPKIKPMKIKTKRRPTIECKAIYPDGLTKAELLKVLKVRDKTLMEYRNTQATVIGLEIENKELRDKIATYSDSNNTCRPSTPIEIKQRKEISDLYQEVKRLRRIVDFFLTASEVVPHDKQRDFFIQSLTKKQ